MTPQTGMSPHAVQTQLATLRGASAPDYFYYSRKPHKSRMNLCILLDRVGKLWLYESFTSLVHFGIGYDPQFTPAGCSKDVIGSH